MDSRRHSCPAVVLQGLVIRQPQVRRTLIAPGPGLEACPLFYCLDYRVVMDWVFVHE